MYKDDDIVRYSFEKRRVQDKEPVYNKLRVHSIAEQSTRYCNYSKDKFDNQVTFCKPAWIKLNLGNYEMIFNPEKELEHTITGDGYIRKTSEIADDVSFLEDCLRAEMKYLSLIKVFNYAPQQAREVLPLCTATEIIHTAFDDDWKHFFDLRYFESTGKVHPNMLELSTRMKEECEKAKIWDSIITSKRHI